MLAALDVADPVSLTKAVTVGLTIAGELLAMVFVYRILVRGGSPASNLLWIAIILSLPWLGLLLYYLLPRSIQLRRLRRIRRRGARAREGRAAGGGRDDARGLAALFAADGALCDDNRVEWLAGGEEFFARVEQAIATARRQVHCVVYILRPDATGRRFLDCLTEAAARGVAVRLLYDSFGSLGLEQVHLRALRAAGGRAEAFLPLLWKRRPFTVNLRNHRKLVVVDGATGFLGGRNIGDEYRTDRRGRTQRWLDAMVAVTGPAVERLQDVFAEDWCHATDELLDGEQPAPEPAGDDTVGIACSGPDRAQSRLWFAIVQAITDARHAVEISSPYLLPPPTLLFALQLAVARGVRVRIHTNGPRTEHPVLYFAQRHYYRRLLAAGVEIHETNEDYEHSKLLVADGRTVVVGSANLDLRSAHLNFEIAIVVLDAPRLAAAVLATVAERRAGCRRITERNLPTHPLARAADGFCGLFAPLL
jgi:cardiolipin synthase